MVAVRPVTPGDLGAVGAALARAFGDDPVMEFLVPGVAPEERARRLARFFAVETKQRARLAGVWTSAGCEGAALWGPPGHWRTTIRDGLGLALPLLRAAGPMVVRKLPVLARIEKVHPKEPHWYLAVLGTDPSHQGRGVGAAVLAPVLERCDREGVPAYLESSKESNIPYYERFGWRVTSELPLSTSGPTIYPMWRDPA